MNKYYKILEFDKIIALVKQYARLPQTQSNLENIKIYNEIEEIQKALDEVDEATILIQRMGSFPLLFHTDISFYLNKVHKYGVLTEEELLEVGNLLDSIKENYLYLDKLDSAEIKVEHFNHKVLSMTYFKDLNLKIKKIITPFGEIKDDASSLLKDLRRKQKDIETSIQKKLQEILNKNQKKLTQNIVSIRNDRFVIPVRVEYKNTFSGIIHDQSASGETVFIEPTIINSLQNQLNQIREEEKQEIYRILKQISLEINNYYDDLMHAYQIFVELDTIFAKAKYAIKIGAQKPQVNNEGIVDLVNCRHPLLNVDNVVSNNINIGTYKGIIITGPNTGGKTVLLKTIGLLAIMVKAGMLIPCDESSNIMIFDNVFADIGDEQSIDQNLSTFSSHLKNIIQIINNVTNESLVLLDELGSGTDPSEGTSLAISIFDYLIKKDCLVIATSHYSELKIYAYNSNDVINASVEFDEKTLKPTYKLLMGVPGMSNALRIAKNLGLHDEIIENAQSYVYQKSDNINKVLEKLIKQEHLLDTKIKEINKQREMLAEKISILDIEKEKVKQLEDKIIIEANQKADTLIQQAKTEIEELLLELKELKKRKDIKQHEIASLSHKFKKIKDRSIPEKQIDENLPIEENIHVYIKTYETYGKVIKKLKNNKFEVQMGNLTVNVDKKHLKPVHIEEKIPRSTGKIVLKKHVSSRLDLHGLRYEDAKLKLEKFLDDAIIGNLHEVTIIHGFGTGVIRKLVHDTLREHKDVVDFRYGGAGEGGQGVTIATLK